MFTQYSMQCNDCVNFSNLITTIILEIYHQYDNSNLDRSLVILSLSIIEQFICRNELIICVHKFKTLNWFFNGMAFKSHITVVSSVFILYIKHIVVDLHKHLYQLKITKGQ